MKKMFIFSFDFEFVKILSIFGFNLIKKPLGQFIVKDLFAPISV